MAEAIAMAFMVATSVCVVVSLFRSPRLTLSPGDPSIFQELAELLLSVIVLAAILVPLFRWLAG